MAEERAQRRLAAILAADVVGYSRLIELDETGTLTLLKDRRRAILVLLVERFQGRIVKAAGQLVDASSGVHPWADRFEGDLQDIFDVQHQVTAKVVGAIAPKLEEAEIERVRRKPTGSLDACDHFLRGMVGLPTWSRAGNSDVLEHFTRAIELDPNYSAASGMAGRAGEASRAIGQLRQLDPGLRVSNSRPMHNFVRPEDFGALVRRAAQGGVAEVGLPSNGPRMVDARRICRGTSPLSDSRDRRGRLQPPHGGG